MAFLNSLLLQTAEHLRILDMLLHAAHLSLITFALLGWLSRRLLPFHLFFIAVIWASWIGLGLYVGHMGYCVLTDWQWRVKWALGERGLPSSYIEYFLWSLRPEDIDDALVSNVTAVVFTAVTVASMVRFRRFYRQLKSEGSLRCRSDSLLILIPINRLISVISQTATRITRHFASK